MPRGPAGRPMVWYSQHWLGFLMYLPASLAAQLIPYGRVHADAASLVLGAAAVHGAAASLLTSLGAGSSFVFALMSFGAVFAVAPAVRAPASSPVRGQAVHLAYPPPPRARSCMLATTYLEYLGGWARALSGDAPLWCASRWLLRHCAQASGPGSLRRALFWAALPTIFGFPWMGLLANVLMDKTSMMGALPPPLGPLVPDVLIGAMLGFSLALTLGFMVPRIALSFTKPQLKVRACV
jgi:hypothetical protein